MILVLAIAIGCLYAGGVYMLLRRSLVKLIIGLILLSHAANLLVFVLGGVGERQPPLIPRNGALNIQQVADPLPQALVLTAIVISFGVLAFCLALVYRTHVMSDTDDLDEVTSAER
jgi:multicomponent Na+:H+ antiporter subunit C